MTTRADIVRVARSWVGVPYRHQGRSRAGVDCVGLLMVVARELGLSDYEFGTYRRLPDPRVLLGELAAQLERVAVADARAGDVWLMAWHADPQHLAIVADRGRIIHAYSQPRAVVEHIADAQWRERVRGAYAFPGVTDV